MGNEDSREPIGAAPSLRATMALAIFFTAALLWGVPELVKWTRKNLPPLIATGSCLPPSEFEQLHIVVSRHDGRLFTECMYVGGRGVYTRRRR